MTHRHRQVEGDLFCSILLDHRVAMQIPAKLWEECTFTGQLLFIAPGHQLNNVSFVAEIETMTYGTNPDWVNAEATVVVEGAMEMLKKKGTLAKGLEGVTRAVEAGVR
jgi:hypothetical protein